MVSGFADFSIFAQVQWELTIFEMIRQPCNAIMYLLPSIIATSC